MSADATNVQFSLINGEIGATATWEITSSAGGTPIVGVFVVTEKNQLMSGIDISGLNPGTITLSLTLSNLGGEGINAIDNATLTITQQPTIVPGFGLSLNERGLVLTLIEDIPSLYTVTFSAEGYTEGNLVEFTLVDAEVGATCNWEITSDSGGTPVTGNFVVATATDAVSDIDVSGLLVGTLTVGVTLTNAAGTGNPVTDTASYVASAPSGTLGQGLVGYYPFDEEANGPYADSSGNLPDATAPNGMGVLVGPFGGNAARPTADDHYLRLPTSPIQSLDDWTLTAWVYYDGTDNLIVFSNQADDRPQVRKGNTTLNLRTTAGEETFGANLNTDWQFFAIRYSVGGSIECRASNQSWQTLSLSGFAVAGSGEFWLGAWDLNGNPALTKESLGWSRLTVHNRILTDAEVEDLYQGVEPV